MIDLPIAAQYAGIFRTPYEAESNRESTASIERWIGHRVMTEMVKLRKLTGELITISPNPSAEAIVENKVDIGNNVRSRTFLGQKTLTKFYTERARTGT